MALSDQLMELAGLAKGLEVTAAAARAKNVARMEEHRAHLRSKVAEAKSDVQGWWTETTDKIEQQRADLETQREQLRGEATVEAAQLYADASEDFASALNALAAFAVDAAAEATVDAALAREQVGSVPQAPVAS